MCSSGPERISAPSFSPGSAGAAAVAAYDKNSNGKIELAEMSPALKDCVKGKSSGKPHDLDGDGALNADEIAARVESYAASRVGLMAVSCEVKVDGVPLPAAIVTLTPEPFLASSIQPASGTTDATGLAILKAEGKEGIQPGMYRIEISKKDASGKESIPAKYNAQSEEGRELAQGIDGMQGILHYDVKSGKPPARK